MLKILPHSTSFRRSFLLAIVAVACFALCPAASHAQQDSSSFIFRYQARVTATQSEQPHWITPLATVTPRLEQEIRTDFLRQTNAKLVNSWNFDNGKGLELIPERHIELLFNAPPFIAHESPTGNDGFGDVSFLGKYRFFARNEQKGNAIVTAFIGGTVPTGKSANGSCCAVITPTLAVGKGFGLFAFTSTAGGSLPASNAHKLGHTITWNSVIQYRLAREGKARFFWPEVESNASYFIGGANDGKSTDFLTPGIVIGRVPLARGSEGHPGRLGLTFGAGEQIAVTRFHSTNHNLIFTARLPF